MTEIIQHVITSTDAWIGIEMQKTDDWVWQLTEDDIGEIHDALAHAKQTGAAIPFAANAFPLGSFGEKLDQIVESVTHGTGVASLRWHP